MMITYDAEGNILNVPVRVGAAVDTVAQAGKPKTISGFQTHISPGNSFFFFKKKNKKNRLNLFIKNDYFICSLSFLYIF